MSFKRARSEEQKKIRMYQMKEVAKEIIVESSYDDVTFVNIAEKLDIQRPLIYTYYKNPADILIEALTDYLYISKIRLHTTETEKELLQAIVNAVVIDEAITKLVGIYVNVLVPTCNYEQLLSFTQGFSELRKEFREKLISFDSSYNEITADEKFFKIWTLLLGFISVQSSSKKMQKAFIEVGDNVFTVDVRTAMFKAIENGEI